MGSQGQTAVDLIDDDDPDSGRFDPRELLRIAAVHRWLIAAITVVVVAATAVLSFTATPYYRAKARLLIERHTNNTVSFQEIYQLGATSDDYYLTQHKILESRAVLGTALASLPGADQAWFAERQPGDPVAAFAALIEVKPVFKSRLVDVLADHPDPAVAGRMADAVVAAYIKNGLDRQSDASSSALTKLQRDAEDLQQKLVAAERAAQEFKSANEIVSTNDRQSLTAARLEKLNDELAEVERARNEAHARLQATEQLSLDRALAGDLPEALASPVVADCKRVLMTARAEMTQLAQSYKPKHPHMQAVLGKVAAMEAELRREVDAVRQGLARQYERALHREADVKKRIEEQTRALIELEGKAIQYAMLRDEVDATRRMHETVVNRLKEVQLIHGAETTNVHRIGPAETSPRPVRPNKLLNVLIALLAGLVIGCGAALTLDLCDRTLKSGEDVANCLGVPALGLVPRFDGRADGGVGLDPATLDERSTASEAFRTIRTALAFTDAGRHMRTLLVTSTAPSEGKSTTSINLAVAFARAGKRVLLVDADLRRPRLHKAFSLQGRLGFSSLLIGNQPLDALVHPTPIDNLQVMPCGVVPPNPVELLGSDGMQAAVAQMTAAFDLVVFDSPPAGIVADASVLATHVDRTVFVVRSLHTNRPLARRAVDQLRAVGASIAGAVVNHSDPRAARYGGYELDYSYRPHQASHEPEAETVQS